MVLHALYMGVVLLFTVISGLIALYLVYASYLLLRGFSPYVPTPDRELDRILSLYDISRKKSFLDVGSGDGRVSLHVARTYPTMKVTGVELHPVLHIFAKFKKLLKKQGNAHFIRSDAHSFDMSRYEVIYCFFLPAQLKIVAQQITSTASKGSIVISRGFKIHELKNSLKISDKQAIYTTYIYRL